MNCKISKVAEDGGQAKVISSYDEGVFSFIFSLGEIAKLKKEDLKAIVL